ncbi:hypothetical protein OAO87_03650 [bacterium]|nr:hypothetical protein [bacterium]
MLRQPAVAMDATAQADVAALVERVEADMRVRLGGGGGGDGSRAPGGSSSSSGGGGGDASSSRSTPPPPEMPVAAEAVLIPTTEEATLSVSANVRRLLEARLSRRLTALESAELDEVLRESLSLLQAGGDEVQRQILAADLGSALLVPGAAHLWGCAVEAAEGDVRSVAAFAEALRNTASEVASALFATALGL